VQIILQLLFGDPLAALFLSQDKMPEFARCQELVDEGRAGVQALSHFLDRHQLCGFLFLIHVPPLS
jgi:hypothetical protein